MLVTKITYEDSNSSIKSISCDDRDQIISYLNDKYPDGYRIVSEEQYWEDLTDE